MAYKIRGICALCEEVKSQELEELQREFDEAMDELDEQLEDDIEDLFREQQEKKKKFFFWD